MIFSKWSENVISFTVAFFQNETQIKKLDSYYYENDGDDDDDDDDDDL